MYDLIVVGAGLSGLQAALTAHEAGLSVVVVEARDRVGGKTWSEPIASRRGVADLGAAWVNTYLQPRVAAYIDKFELETVIQRTEGRAVMQLNSQERSEFPFGIMPEFLPEEKQDLSRIRDHIQAASLRREKPSANDDIVTLDQYVRNLGAMPSTIRMLNVWSQVMHGVESSMQSAAWFIDYCRCNKGLLAIRADDVTGGQHQRLAQGTQAISVRIARLIGMSRIHTSCPVIGIEDRGNSVAVSTTTGAHFVARKAIISIPSTMIKELNISPPLPERVRQVVDSTILGDYNKAIMVYDRPWWRDLGFNGFFMSFAGPMIVGRDTSVDSKGFYSITAFCNGKGGAEWAALYPHQRRRAVLDQLAHIFDQKQEGSEVYKPIEVLDQIWRNERYSRGALAPITALGHLTEFADVYGKPVGNLHFVGTEYSNEWRGYMEGALCSGEKGGQEVINALRSSSRAVL